MTDREYGVIFDMDGVLVDSSDAHYESWRALGDEIGAPHEREFFDRTFGMHNSQIIPLWLGADVTARDLQRLADRKEELFRAIAPTAVQPLPGAVELVRQLRGDGARLAVGSSAPRANVELMLGVLDIAECFAGVACGDEVSHGKPNPEVFEKAARKLGLPPSQCVVIEDAPQGVAAGKRAGAMVVAVTSTRDERELAEADLVVPSLDGLTPSGLRNMALERRSD